MFLRIKNRLDMELLEEELRKIGLEEIVINRLKEIVDSLDDAYGSYRNAYAMGGYVLLFLDNDIYEKSFDKIMNFYNLDKEMYEYSDCINEKMTGNVSWWEELYLLSSDDSLVLVHPRNE